MMTKAGSTKNVNFMTCSVQCACARAWSFRHVLRQTKNMVMMAMEGSTLVVKFCDPRTGFLVLGCGLIRHMVKMFYFFKSLYF